MNQRLRLARACDGAIAGDEQEGHLKRIGTAIGKYWVCKRGPAVGAEALECLGGNGYVEESMMPRLYREMPLNSIWEGSGNVNCLDVLRAMQREPETVEALFNELALAHGANAHLDAAVSRLQRDLADNQNIEVRARRLVEHLALALQGALLVRHSHPAIAGAFCATRLGGDWGAAFGTLPPGVDVPTIIQRTRPQLG